MITTSADHKKCTYKPSSEEMKDSGKEERDVNFLNRTAHAALGLRFAANDPAALRGEVTAQLPATESLSFPRQPVAAQPRCQGCCWCSRARREQLALASLTPELLSREQGTSGAHAAPAPAAGTPTRLARHVQKPLFL